MRLVLFTYEVEQVEIMKAKPYHFRFRSCKSAAFCDHGLTVLTCKETWCFYEVFE